MKRLKWQALKAGDIVDLVAPGSGLLDTADINPIVEFIRQWGLVPRYSPDLISSNPNQHPPYLSNTDDARFDQLQAALFAEDSQAVWCVRGGYGCMKLLPQLQALTPPKQSKLVIGFSDITVLHLFLHQQWGWETVHGEMLTRWYTPESAEKMALLKDVIFGVKPTIQYVGMVPLNVLAQHSGRVEGAIMVGNLSLLQSSLGTFWQLDTKDKILVIEEVHERGYRIDRILEQLYQAGTLSMAKAIIFADMAVGVDQKEAELVDTVLQQLAHKLSIPVYQIKGIGHGENNHPLPMGGQGIIETDFSLTCFF